MKPTYALFAALCAGVVLATTNCGDRTATGPVAPVIQSSVSNGDHERDHRHRHNHHRPPNLARCRPQRADVALQRIGPDGGRIDVGPYTLTVPQGALTRGVFIHARIRAGKSINVVEFQPDGLVFEKPASLSMSYKNCDVDEDGVSLRIAVVDDAFGILYYLPSTTDHASRRIRGEVAHFTNYAVAW